jgi:hypothetical protein
MKKSLTAVALVAVLVACYCLLAKGRIGNTSDRRMKVTFHLHGYLLVNDRDSLDWYRVQIPEGHWDKVASGSLWSGADCEDGSDDRHCLLAKVEGTHLHQMDVRTGSEQLIPFPPNRNSDGTRGLESNGYVLTTASNNWFMKHNGECRAIPIPKGLISQGAEITPWCFINPPEFLIFKGSYADQRNVIFDFVLLDTVSGRSRNVLHMDGTNVYLMRERNTGRTYTLHKDCGLLECWEMSKSRFVRTRQWQLPPTAHNESYSDLVSVNSDEWIIYGTVTAQHWLFADSLIQTKYYAFNKMSGSSVLVLNPPVAHQGSDAIAWLRR